MPEKETTQTRRKRFATIACEDGEKWGFEEGICDYLIGVFRNKKDDDADWLAVHGISGKLPTMDEVKYMDGILMSGSRHSANDNKEWVVNLMQFVRNVRDLQATNGGKPKLVGLCFSHQLIAKAFGGEVAANPSGRFVVMAEKLSVSRDILSKTYYKRSIPNGKDSLVLLESHGESVTLLPPDANSVASSPTCENEIILYGDHIMTVQGHPEMFAAAIVQHILPSLKAKQVINDEDICHSKKTFELNMDSEATVAMLQRFLNVIE